MASTGMFLQNAINETAGLEFVQVFHRDSEHFLAQVLDVLLVESVLPNKVQDQIPLLVATVPSRAVAMPV
jgi:hypothetical protein